MTEFRSTWLVQRLQKPRNLGLGPFMDNPFSFGGGYKNGGLSDEAMGLLRSVFSFDYMGSAEFEFGALPKTLQKLAQSDLVSFSIALPLAKVERNWRDENKGKPKGTAPVYVLCPKEWRSEVEERIRELAAGGYRLKERDGLATALRPVGEFDGETCGWLELDNGFAFFTDPEMWQRTCVLFGVQDAPTAPGTGASKDGTDPGVRVAETNT